MTPLPAMDVAGRVARLRGGLEAAGCDALLVTHLTNIRYLTGFTGSAALLLVGPDTLTFVTDGRYEEQAGGQLEANGSVPLAFMPSDYGSWTFSAGVDLIWRDDDIEDAGGQFDDAGNFVPIGKLAVSFVY